MSLEHHESLDWIALCFSTVSLSLVARIPLSPYSLATGEYGLASAILDMTSLKPPSTLWVTPDIPETIFGAESFCLMFGFSSRNFLCESYDQSSSQTSSFDSSK